jgi:hypothetical protein
VSQWPCEAYGEEGIEHGVLCFIAPELGQRKCDSAGTCHAVMAEERQRVFDRIHELAAAGDEVSQFLAEEFTSPDMLLGGDEPLPH